MTKCKICKKEASELYTNDKWQLVCRQCLEKSIYSKRKKSIKKGRKNDRRKQTNRNVRNAIR